MARPVLRRAAPAHPGGDRDSSDDEDGPETAASGDETPAPGDETAMEVAETTETAEGEKASGDEQGASEKGEEEAGEGKQGAGEAGKQGDAPAAMETESEPAS